MTTRTDTAEKEAGVKTRILVVDDDPRLVKALRINLIARGYDVITATTGSEGVRRAADQHPDLVILDLGLPDLDGTEVLAGIRGWTSLPVIVLTARDTSIDKVSVLDSGADDYITKPFAMEELLARVRLALRHAAPRGQRTGGGMGGGGASNHGVEERPEPVVRAGNLLIDLAATRVTRKGKDIHLTPTEWRVLEVLVRAQGRLVRRDELLNAVWGPGHESESHYIRVYIAQLRRKLEDNPAQPQHLFTETGLGHRFLADSPEEAEEPEGEGDARGE